MQADCLLAMRLARQCKCCKCCTVLTCFQAYPKFIVTVQMAKINKKAQNKLIYLYAKKHIGIVHFFLTNAGLTYVCETQECTFQTRTLCFSALKGPVSIRPLQEAASSITVSVNIVSPHLPIGSLCFGLQHLCFQTCVYSQALTWLCSLASPCQNS